MSNWAQIAAVDEEEEERNSPPKSMEIQKRKLRSHKQQQVAVKNSPTTTTIPSSSSPSTSSTLSSSPNSSAKHVSLDQLSFQVQEFANLVFSFEKMQQSSNSTNPDDKSRLKMRATRQKCLALSSEIESAVRSYGNQLSRLQGDLVVRKTIFHAPGSNTTQKQGQSSKNSWSMTTQNQGSDDEEDANTNYSLQMDQKKQMRQRQFEKLKANFEDLLSKFNRLNDTTRTTKAYDMNGDGEDELENGIVIKKRMPRGTAPPSAAPTLDQQQQMQLQKQKKIVLTKADWNTLDTEKMLADETFTQVREMEKDFLELHELFQDLNTLVHDQQTQIDIIHDNVTSSNKSVERGVENIKVATARTGLGPLKKVTNFITNIPRSVL